MKRAIINPVLCQNCTECILIDSCHMKALFRESDSDKPWVDFYRCSGCMKCAALCPSKAVSEITQPCDGKKRMGW